MNSIIHSQCVKLCGGHIFYRYYILRKLMQRQMAHQLKYTYLNGTQIKHRCYPWSLFYDKKRDLK